MKVSPKKLLPLIVFAIAVTSLFSVHPAQAGYIVTMQQVGTDVVANGGGVIDLNGLTEGGAGDDATPFVRPLDGVLQTGPGSLEVNVFGYFGLSGPTSFGSGSQTNADVGSGDNVLIWGLQGQLRVPLGFVSGNPLSSGAIWHNQTIAGLGLTPGVYEWTWGTGPDQSVTLEIAAQPNTISDCQNNGWQTRTHGDGSPFRNQGQCIQYVNTGK